VEEERLKKSEFAGEGVNLVANPLLGVVKKCDVFSLFFSLSLGVPLHNDK